MLPVSKGAYVELCCCVYCAQALFYYDAAITCSPHDESAYLNRAITKVGSQVKCCLV